MDCLKIFKDSLEPEKLNRTWYFRCGLTSAERSWIITPLDQMAIILLIQLHPSQSDSILYWCLGFFCPSYRISRYCHAALVGTVFLSRSFWTLPFPSRIYTSPIRLLHRLGEGTFNPVTWLVLKILDGIRYTIDPWETPLVTDCQLDFSH